MPPQVLQMDHRMVNDHPAGSVPRDIVKTQAARESKGSCPPRCGPQFAMVCPVSNPNERRAKPNPHPSAPMRGIRKPHVATLISPAVPAAESPWIARDRQRFIQQPADPLRSRHADCTNVEFPRSSLDRRKNRCAYCLNATSTPSVSVLRRSLIPAHQQIKPEAPSPEISTVESKRQKARRRPYKPACGRDCVLMNPQAPAFAIEHLQCSLCRKYMLQEALMRAIADANAPVRFKHNRRNSGHHQISGQHASAARRQLTSSGTKHAHNPRAKKIVSW